VLQHGDQRWSGHREITRAAVHRLFEEAAGRGGRIRGIAEQDYADALDRGQARQDRLVGVGVIRHFAGTSLPFPYAGPGPTAHSAYANPDRQREHFLADPYRSGPENLRLAVGHMLDELGAANRAGDVGQQMRHLGAAVHALQDGYSGAHVWRDDSVYAGDPAALVLALNVFTPGHVIGLGDGRNSHADVFDRPPAGSGTTRAAVEATYRMLRAHEAGLTADPQQAAATLRRTLGPLVRPSPRGVTVNLVPDRQWAVERDRRIALEHATARPPR
jgi:hypothetical protein